MESSLSHKKPMTLPTWKMYENPLFTTTTTTSTTTTTQEQEQEQELYDQQHPPHSLSSSGVNNNPVPVPKLHILQLPISARKIAASFWDLSFVKPVMMESQMVQLKEEVERERGSRKKAESLNKKLGREFSEERKRREAVERVCQQLVGELSVVKEEICRLKMEMEEERKMMRMSEVFREERVRMKLAEARVLMEEKLIDHGLLLRCCHYCNCEEEEDDDHHQVELAARLATGEEDEEETNFIDQEKKLRGGGGGG